MFILVFLCCVVLCRQRPCNGPTSHPRSPTKCRKTKFRNLKKRRPRFFKNRRATRKEVECVEFCMVSFVLTEDILGTEERQRRLNTPHNSTPFVPCVSGADSLSSAALWILRIACRENLCSKPEHHLEFWEVGAHEHHDSVTRVSFVKTGYSTLRGA
jgi:hypothetical protein